LDFTVRWRAECGGVPEHHGLGVRRPAEPRRSARQLAAGRTQPGADFYLPPSLTTDGLVFARDPNRPGGGKPLTLDRVTLK